MAPEFVHLHVHSEFSLLDGLGRVNDLVKHAASLGQKAMALTDQAIDETEKLAGASEKRALGRHRKVHRRRIVPGVDEDAPFSAMTCSFLFVLA